MVRTEVWFVASIFVLSIFIFCSTKKQAVSIQNPSSKQMITTPVDIIGQFSLENLDPMQYPWYWQEFDAYSPKSQPLQMLKNFNHTYKVLVFLGTWCSDSKREVPRFEKIMRSLSVDRSFVTYYGLDKAKNSPDQLEKNFKISHVPTFIILQNEIEIGRIVETPIQSLEEDLLTILLKQPYKPNYAY